MGLRLLVRVPAGHHPVRRVAGRSARPDAVLGDLLSWWIRVERGPEVAVQSASGADGRRLRHAVRIL